MTPDRPTVVELTVKQLKEEFAGHPFEAATLRRCRQGYSLSLLTKAEVFPVLTKHAGDLKQWSSVDRAVAFIRKHHPMVTTIKVSTRPGDTP